MDYFEFASLHDDALVDETITAKAIGRAEPTLRKDRWAGTGIPYHKIGRSVRYRVGDIRDYLKSCRVHSTTQAGV
jgi:hypothetical protein